MMKTVHATMRATLGGGDLMNAVKCPPGEDLNEWIAVNTVQSENTTSEDLLCNCGRQLGSRHTRCLCSLCALLFCCAQVL